MVGEIVGSYRIESELGIGGMGAVYLAKHTILDKWAAVKMLRPKWSKDPEAIGRFFTEATATTAVRHAGIVDVYDFGHHESGSAYLVMELLEGETLGEKLREEDRLAEHHALAFAWQAVRALAAAHAAGIVHRDLKPDNIFLSDDPAAVGGVRVKLLDFGIAKLRRPGARSYTSPEEIVGTPLYMSPEHCMGQELDGRSDIYSIACVLFQAISGRPPFCSQDYGELLRAHVGEVPPHLTEIWPQTRPEVSDLVFRCLSKDAASRPTAHELAEMLRTLADAPLEVTVPPREATAPPADARAVPLPLPVMTTRPATHAATPWSLRRWAAVGAAAALVLGLAATALLQGGNESGERTPAGAAIAAPENAHGLVTGEAATAASIAPREVGGEPVAIGEVAAETGELDAATLEEGATEPDTITKKGGGKHNAAPIKKATTPEVAKTAPATTTTDQTTEKTTDPPTDDTKTKKKEWGALKD